MKKLTKKNVYLLLIICLVIAFVVDIIVRFAFSPEHGAGSFPGFYVIFGFVGGVLLILLAKKFLGPSVQKDEAYYDGGKEYD